MLSIKIRYISLFIATLISACSTKEFLGVYESTEGVYLHIQKDSTYQLYSKPSSHEFFESKGRYRKISEDSIVFSCLTKPEKLLVTAMTAEKSTEYTSLLVESEFKYPTSINQGNRPEDYALGYFSVDSVNWQSIPFRKPIKIDGEIVIFKIEYLHGVLPVMRKKEFLSSWFALESAKLNSFNIIVDFSQINYVNTHTFTGIKVKRGIRIEANEQFLDTNFFRVEKSGVPFSLE